MRSQAQLKHASADAANQGDLSSSSSTDGSDASTIDFWASEADDKGGLQSEVAQGKRTKLDAPANASQPAGALNARSAGPSYSAVLRQSARVDNNSEVSQGERTGQDLKPNVAKQNVLQLETAAFEKGRRAHLTEQQARWERIRSQPQPLQLRRTPPTAMTSTSGDFPYAGRPGCSRCGCSTPPSLAHTPDVFNSDSGPPTQDSYRNVYLCADCVQLKPAWIEMFCVVRHHHSIWSDTPLGQRLADARLQLDNCIASTADVPDVHLQALRQQVQILQLQVAGCELRSRINVKQQIFLNAAVKQRRTELQHSQYANTVPDSWDKAQDAIAVAAIHLSEVDKMMAEHPGSAVRPEVLTSLDQQQKLEFDGLFADLNCSEDELEQLGEASSEDVHQKVQVRQCSPAQLQKLLKFKEQGCSPAQLCILMMQEWF